LLNRSKVIVNLRSNGWHPELVRFVLAAACGTAIVSDLPANNSAPFVVGRDFLAVGDELLAAAIAEQVRNDDSRSALASSATALVHTELTMSRAAAAFLALSTS
jgi:Glycosyl transferases group 1